MSVPERPLVLQTPTNLTDSNSNSCGEKKSTSLQQKIGLNRKDYAPLSLDTDVIRFQTGFKALLSTEEKSKTRFISWNKTSAVFASINYKTLRKHRWLFVTQSSSSGFLGPSGQVVFFHFPFYSLSSCQTFLVSHFHTDWHSRLGLGNQVGSTTDHL